MKQRARPKTSRAGDAWQHRRDQTKHNKNKHTHTQVVVSHQMFQEKIKRHTKKKLPSEKRKHKTLSALNGVFTF
jgi:hypothetical protein